MRKNYILTSFFILSLLFPFSVQAAEQSSAQNITGYTIDNIQYEVYGTDFVQLTTNSIFVSRKITYDGFCIPSKQISWKEEIEGVTYSGTLTLIRNSFDANTQKTIAVYEGTLTANQ